MNKQLIAQKNKVKEIALARLDAIESRELELVDLAYREVEAIIDIGSSIDLTDPKEVSNFKKLKDSAAATVNLMTRLGVYVSAKRGDLRVNMRVVEEPSEEMKMAERIVAKARERLAHGRTTH